MEVVYIALALYGITHVMVYKDGPCSVLQRIRSISMGVLDCVPCVSFWFCIILALSQGALVAGAVYGIVILLDKITVKLMI